MEWAGRVRPTGAFSEHRSEDLLAMLQAALDHVPEALVAVLDRDRTVLLARGRLVVDSGIDPGDVESPAGAEDRLAGFWRTLEPALARALDGDVADLIVDGPGGRVVDVRVGPVHDAEDGIPACVVIAHDVTERRAVHDDLAEQHRALLESQERYRLLAENSSDFVMRTTPDGIIEWISEGMVDVLGWQPEEMVGRRSLDFAHPDHVAQVLSQTSQVNVGAVVSGRLQVRAKDGSYRWMFRTLRPVRDAEGQVVARVSGWHDAGAEVAAEERLAASEELFRVAMDSSAIGMALVGREGNFLRVNPAYCAMVEYEADELAAMRFQELTHPLDADQGESEGTRVVRGQSAGFRQRKRYVTKSGRELWVDVSVAGVRASDGSFHHLVVQAVDVSAEVANFEALQRAARDYRTLAENASDVVLRVDVQGLITWISPSVRTVLGWDPELLTGTPSISLVEHADRDKVLGARERVLHEARTEFLLARFRTTWGTTVEMSGSGRPIVDDRGEVVGNVIGLRDVSDEMAIRRELAFRASHDSLTGVSNRDDLLRRLAQRLELPPVEDDAVGLLFCDVDELKALNDTWGHAAGDAVLVEVARRLESAVRRADVVARLSGDEFVILLDRVTDLAALEAVIEKCRQSVATIVAPGGRPVSISVGGIIAEAREDAATLVDRADAAMMRDKQRARRERGVTVRGTPPHRTPVPPAGTTVDAAEPPTDRGTSARDVEPGVPDHEAERRDERDADQDAPGR